MARKEFETLTPQMFYILVVLNVPRHGYEIMNEIQINQRIIAGNVQFKGIAAGRGVGFTTGLLLLRKGLGMQETPIRPHSWHCRMQYQTINMTETERDPRCGEGTGGLFVPRWKESWAGCGMDDCD